MVEWCVCVCSHLWPAALSWCREFPVYVASNEKANFFFLVFFPGHKLQLVIKFVQSTSLLNHIRPHKC